MSFASGKEKRPGRPQKAARLPDNVRKLLAKNGSEPHLEVTGNGSKRPCPVCGRPVSASALKKAAARMRVASADSSAEPF